MLPQTNAAKFESGNADGLRALQCITARFMVPEEMHTWQSLCDFTAQRMDRLPATVVFMQLENVTVTHDVRLQSGCSKEIHDLISISFSVVPASFRIQPADSSRIADLC